MWKCLTAALTLAPLLGTAAQVRQPSSTTASGAVAGVNLVPPTKVGTAAVHGLLELRLAEGKEATVGAGKASKSRLRRERREGKLVLVRTLYEKGPSKYGHAPYLAVSEELYPGETKLIAAGPWQVGWQSVRWDYYLLVPLDPGARRAPRPIRGTRTLKSVAGGVTPPTSKAADAAPIPTAQAALKAECGIPTNPGGLGELGEFPGLSCLQLGILQGTDLPGGIKVFRRNEYETEAWHAGTLLRTGRRVMRDRAGRHWILEPLTGWWTL